MDEQERGGREVIVELEDVGDDCAVSTKDTELGTLKQMSIVNVKCQSHTWDLKIFLLEMYLVFVRFRNFA